MATIVVTGACSGLGLEISRALEKDGHEIIPFDIKMGDDVRTADVSAIDRCDVLINNAGVNLINWLEKVTDDDWDKVMDVNAKGIFKMTQALLPKLIESKGTVVNIVSNAAHMPMTCSLAYNASKGAAHIMTLQLARELTRRFGITVFGIAPNKLGGTGMSDDIDNQVVETRGWTKEEAKTYQLQSLLAGEETDPKALAGFLAYLLRTKDNHKYLTGCIMPYGA